MVNKITVVVFIAGLLLGAGLCLKLAPASKETKTDTKEVQTEIQKDNVKTIVTEVDKPDGTKQIQTTIVDNTIKNVDTIEDKKQDIKVNAIPQWHVSIGYLKTVTDLTQSIYQMSVERKILGPFSLGVTGTSDKQIGLLIGFEF